MGEIIIIMGAPAAGKTTLTRPFMKMGYQRLNRDDLGGSTKEGSRLMTALHELHAYGTRRFVLDNTYASVDSRAVVVQAGKRLGLPVRCIHLTTSKEQAQFNAARRQVQRYGVLLRKDDFKKDPFKDDPGMFPPGAQFAYWKRFQPPSMDEGFSAIEEMKFELDLGPEYVNRAIILDYDGTLRETISGFIYPRHPDEVRVLPGRRERLLRLWDGWVLCGASNQSGISKEDPDDEYHVTEEQAIACFDKTNELLGLDIDVEFAPDRAGVPQTFWRKPCPGMSAIFVERYKLDPDQCVVVGDMKSDQTFAQRSYMQFRWAHEFFGE